MNKIKNNTAISIGGELMPTAMSVICCSATLLNESIYVMISLRIANYQLFESFDTYSSHQSIIMIGFLICQSSSKLRIYSILQLKYDFQLAIKFFVYSRAAISFLSFHSFFVWMHFD